MDTNLENIPEEAKCPSCGKFVGAYEICPHCQANLKGRMALKLIRRISVIGAILGLIFLWWASKNKEVQLVHISDMGLSMNNALVKVEGTVLKVKKDKIKDSFKITLDDGTGRMTLGGFGKLTLFQKELGSNFPSEGDIVEVRGNLNISEKWGAMMFMSTPNRLKILKKFILTEKKLKNITEDDVNKFYKVFVQIVGHKKFRSGYNLKIADSTATQNLTIFDSQIEGLDDDIINKLITPGSLFKMVVLVDEYRGHISLKIKDFSSDDFRYIRKDPIPKQFLQPETKKQKLTSINIDKITEDNLYKQYELKATVKSVKFNRGGGVLSLSHGNKSIDMFVANNQIEKIKGGKKTLDKSKTFEGKVKVSKYRENIQLKLIFPQDAKFF